MRVSVCERVCVCFSIGINVKPPSLVICGIGGWCLVFVEPLRGLAATIFARTVTFMRTVADAPQYGSARLPRPLLKSARIHSLRRYEREKERDRGGGGGSGGDTIICVCGGHQEHKTRGVFHEYFALALECLSAIPLLQC